MSGRHAFLVRTTPMRTFRVRSASRGPARLVVEQADRSLRCNCPAADFRAECSHVRLVARSIARRDRTVAA